MAKKKKNMVEAENATEAAETVLDNEEEILDVTEVSETEADEQVEEVIEEIKEETNEVEEVLEVVEESKKTTKKPRKTKTELAKEAEALAIEEILNVEATDQVLHEVVIESDAQRKKRLKEELKEENRQAKLKEKAIKLHQKRLKKKPVTLVRYETDPVTGLSSEAVEKRIIDNVVNKIELKGISLNKTTLTVQVELYPDAYTVIIVVPTCLAITFPFESTVATSGLLLFQLTSLLVAFVG